MRNIPLLTEQEFCVIADTLAYMQVYRELPPNSKGHAYMGLCGAWGDLPSPLFDRLHRRINRRLLGGSSVYIGGAPCFVGPRIRFLRDVLDGRY